jgi:hypothetical protein
MNANDHDGPGAEKALAEAGERVWTVVSMCNDFKGGV